MMRRAGLSKFYTLTFHNSKILQVGIFADDHLKKQVAGNGAKTFNGNFWHHCISVFEAAAAAATGLK